ncbi:MAG: acyltransferase [Bacteroidaceae bacterium]|nr:acyltransferase [Bacteroidaceae bacterium]
MEKRVEISWVNWARAICIVLIYFAHSVEISGQPIPDWLHCLYSYVYVNVFFFVSGFLILGKKVQPSNIFFRIMVPAVIFSILEYFPKVLLRGGELSAVSFMTETLGGGTYWFLSALAVAQLIIWALQKTGIKSIWFYVLCSVLLGLAGIMISRSGFAVIGYDDSFPWKYKQGMICTLFMSAGALYGKYIGNRSLPTWAFLSLTCAYVLGCVLFTGHMGDSSVLYCSLQVSGFLWSMVGILCVVEFCRRLPECGLIRYVGRNTILFYMMSGAIPTVLTIMFNRYLTLNAISLLLIFVLSFAIAMIATMIIVRYMPFVKDLRTLSKKNK